jgi:hypothetical protein
VPPGTVLVVTADHGQMHLERRLDRSRCVGATRRRDGGWRGSVTCARKGAAKELGGGLRTCRRACGCVREVLDDGWIGAGQPAAFGPARRRRARFAWRRPSSIRAGSKSGCGRLTGA